jgi:hypothetical protein
MQFMEFKAIQTKKQDRELRNFLPLELLVSLIVVWTDDAVPRLIGDPRTCPTFKNRHFFSDSSQPHPQPLGQPQHLEILLGVDLTISQHLEALTETGINLERWLQRNHIHHRPSLLPSRTQPLHHNCSPKAPKHISTRPSSSHPPPQLL